MTETPERISSVPVRAAICVDRDAFDRFGRVIRHLTVGLVDQAIQLRLLSSDPRIEKLTLGPVQSLYHPPLNWPFRNRRITHLVEDLSHPEPPNIIHALSHESYSIALSLARLCDADLVLQVTSLEDCDQLMEIESSRVGRYFTFTQPLVDILEKRLGIPRDRIDLIRPGILSSRDISCFSDPQRVVTLLCTAPLQRGTGMDRLIESIAMLKQRGHEILVFLLGQGKHENILRQIVRETKLSSCVTFVQPISDPGQAMRSADILVIPTNATTFTASDLEAMGAGMAIITYPSAVSDYLRNGETAIVCLKPSAKALADVIESLIKDTDRTRKIAVKAMEYVKKHHAVSTMAENTATAYRKLSWSRATFPIKESATHHGPS